VAWYDPRTWWPRLTSGAPEQAPPGPPGGGGVPGEIPPEMLAAWAARGNHSQGVIPISGCQSILGAVAGLPEEHPLKYKLAAAPLGHLLVHDKGVVLDVARLAGEHLPPQFDPEVMAAYGYDEGVG